MTYPDAFRSGEFFDMIRLAVKLACAKPQDHGEEAETLGSLPWFPLGRATLSSSQMWKQPADLIMGPHHPKAAISGDFRPGLDSSTAHSPPWPPQADSRRVLRL